MFCVSTAPGMADLPSGSGGCKHPNGVTECRMGESPAAERSEQPGTQAAQRPSSFRRGRERSEVRGSGRRSLSVTCLLRRFTGSVRVFTESRDANAPKSGCLR